MSVLTLNAKLDRTESSTPWGFRMQGGKDFNGPLQIQRVNPGSLADRCGVKAGDTILKIGSVATDGLKHKEAQNVIISSGNSLELTLQRGGGSGGATPYVPYQASYNTPAPQSYSSPGSQNLSNQMQGMNISNNQPRAAPVQRAPAKPLEDITQSATYQMLKQSDPAPYRSGDGNNNASSGGRKQSRTFMMLQNMIDSGEELPTPALAKTQNKPQQEEEERYTAVMHSQYNTPIGLYSADNALDTFKGQVKDIVPDASELPSQEAKAIQPSETMRLVQDQDNQPMRRENESTFTGTGSDPIHSRTFKVLQSQMSGGGAPAGPPSQGYKPAPAPAPVTFTPKPAAPKSTPAPWSPPKPAPGGGSGTKFGRKGDASLKREGEGMSGRIPMCVACGATISGIRGPFILALGKSWCPNHFTCANTGCGMSLVDIGFVEENGQLYCEQDYAKYFAPRCHKCSSAIVGECVKATGHDYHPHCFLCAHCRQPIGKGGFHIEEGQPYCLKDWGDMFQTKCLGCEFAIEPGDRWVEALNGNWHSECFNCSQCQVNLEGQSFYAKHGRPYCKKHAGGF